MTSQSRKTTTRAKLDAERVAMETQIKELEAQSKSKDSQIKTLKQQLDQMMLLAQNNQQPVEGEDGNHGDGGGGGEPSFLSLVKLNQEDEDARSKVDRLQDENLKLRNRIDEMILLQQSTNKQDKRFQKDERGCDEVLSSSTEDIDSAAGSLMRSSTSISRSTSTENLLDDVVPSSTYLTLSGVARSTDATCGDRSSCETVACLTERIHQMQESHISTNEELEATVQELNDLQKSVPELAIDNERLRKELKVLMEQVEESERKLAEQQTESTHLRTLVSDHLNEDSNHNDLKQQYVCLLDERRHILECQGSLNSALRRAEETRKEAFEEAEDLRENVRSLERELKQARADKKVVDSKLKATRESTTLEQQRLREELRVLRQRNRDLLQLNEASGSEDNFVAIVDGLRGEKQEMEEESRELQAENDKLDARVSELEEYLEATISKAKKDSSELSELIDRLNEEVRMKNIKLEEANETIFVMEDSVEQQIAVQKHERHTIQQLQNQMSTLKEERVRFVKEIQQLKREQRNQSHEWRQFQSDMQMAVSIANDMKAETQQEVEKLREEKQTLEDDVTKLRVENEQLRRKRMTSHTSSHSPLERRGSEVQEVQKIRRNLDASPGVQSLIKSFDSQSSTTMTRGNSVTVSPASTPLLENSPNPPASDDQSPATFKISPIKSPPSIATISPMQRHHSLTSLTSASNTNAKSPAATSSSSNSSKTTTPDGARTNTDLGPLSSFLRRNSAAEARKPSSLDVSRTNQSDRTQPAIPSTQASDKQRGKSRGSIVSGADPLVTLARKYGGSKRNALLQWCQKKTKDYPGIDITNFSTSWSDGLALCALIHSYLPAHIPYLNLANTYTTSNDERQRKLLQAKHFRLALAAAESSGIEPTLSVESMTLNERPDWQGVMKYVTQLYKYFET